MQQQGFSRGLWACRVFVLSLCLVSFVTWGQVKPFSKQPKVAAFIQHMVSRYQFSKPKLTSLFDQIKIQHKVLKAIAAPYEAKPWSVYQRRFVTEKRIEEGVAYWQQHQKALNKAQQKYGIPPAIIVAILGIESNYGKRQGAHPVLDTLATLAFEYPPRAKFFKKELLQFLLLTRELKIDPKSVSGSYAGAIGQPQFIPSSYRHYAVDFSGNGSADLRQNSFDVIGSIANYFNKHGWQKGQPIAEPAKINGTKISTLKKNTRKPTYRIKTLEKYGITPVYQTRSTRLAGIIALQDHKKPEYWLGFNNFYVITRYNKSPLYAMAVTQLAQKIKARHTKQHWVKQQKKSGSAA